MPQSPRELERIGEEASEKDQRFELADTAIETVPPELEGGQMALKSALRMDEADIHAIALRPKGSAPDAALRSSQEKPLPLSSPGMWKGGKILAARRHRIRSTSPSTRWNKPLANGEDALNWKLSVLHKFDAIEYTV